MRHAGMLALVVACAGACLAKEYSITKSFGEDQGDDVSFGGGSGSGRGGNGGTASPPSGGEGGEDMGTGGSTGGSTGGNAGEASGGSSAGGSAGTAGAGSGGRAGGGRGGSGGSQVAGSGGRGGAGAGGASGTGGAGKGGTGGTGGTGGSGTSGTGGMPACGVCIVHRYAFSGTDTTATDSVGTAHGTIVGGTQSGGVVTLAGGTTDQYVSLPTGVLSGLSDLTLEFWVTWTGGTSNWQRVFDFGSNDGLAGDQGSTNTSNSYFFFTPRAQATSSSAGCTTSTASLPRVTFTLAGPASETCVFGAGTFPPSTITQVAVTIQSSTLSLYLNGAAFGAPATLPASLASVTRTNNWLGRSQFSSDTEFAGTIHEFRVYSVARSLAQLAASYAAGPDTPPTQ